ncbi:hypothetical protein C2845_PM16G04290 [Panicum miliaceum]|uniref:Uncharacterized protein n=1 Tax=Panicum miliaceum TaxID=4540 RepID=A0A3L6PUD9_PANMI|nr:hypothetical protein C2845_PM16G04290 [Panicum miliaceum]
MHASGGARGRLQRAGRRRRTGGGDDEQAAAVRWMWRRRADRGGAQGYDSGLGDGVQGKAATFLLLRAAWPAGGAASGHGHGDRQAHAATSGCGGVNKRMWRPPGAVVSAGASRGWWAWRCRQAWKPASGGRHGHDEIPVLFRPAWHASGGTTGGTARSVSMVVLGLARSVCAWASPGSCRAAPMAMYSRQQRVVHPVPQSQ